MLLAINSLPDPFTSTICQVPTTPMTCCCKLCGWQACSWPTVTHAQDSAVVIHNTYELIQLMTGASAEAGDWPGALEDYQAAGDAAAIVRILLGPMQRPEEACEIARHSGNQAALQQAAAYLLQTGNHEVGHNLRRSTPSVDMGAHIIQQHASSS